VTETSELFVFAGRDKDGAPVTVRMPRALRGMSATELDDALASFVLEAEQLERICKASPHVEELLAWGDMELPDRERVAYCVFARTDGSSLAQMRGRGAQSLGRSIAALESVAMALAAAHDIGACHGDVRPENLILVEAGAKPVIKLVRFTLATRFGSTGTRVFAPEYAAPEHFKRSFGDDSIGPPTDVYGLALCLVELVTGRPPFDGTHPTELYKQTTDITRRPTLIARGASVPQAVDAVVARAVAVNPKLRWPNARDFWSALTAAAGPDILADSVVSLPDVPSSKEIVEPAPSSGQNAPPSSGTPPSSAAPPSSGTENAPASGGAPAPAGPSAAQASQPSTARPLGTSRAVLVGGIVSAAVALVLAMVMIAAALSRPKEEPAAETAAIDAGAAPVAKASPSTSTSASASTSTSGDAGGSAASDDVPPGMVKVPAGTFVMGKDSDRKSERPAHRVTITRAFYIDRTEVTAEAYAACVEAGACERRTVHVKKQSHGAWGCNNEKDRGKHPANCVDRNQAAAYCAFVKKRLPTEAEWEYAARGTDGREYPWGNTPPTTCAVAVLAGATGGCGERRGTSAVGTATEGASAFGALDMGGNVWEWVADDYAPYPSGEVTDPLVKLPTRPKEPPPRGVLRGGSWDYAATAARATYRLPWMTDAGNASIGFRCALTAP